MSHYVLTRLCNEDFELWEETVKQYEIENKKILVPSDNSVDTLHNFNIKLNELYTKAYYEYARSRRNKDAIERLIDNVLKQFTEGKNEAARKAAAIDYAKNFPNPSESFSETVDLFYLEDRFLYFYYSLDATIQTLKAKAESKITNNSLLKLEKSIL
jgi:hypothetical protein